MLPEFKKIMIEKFDNQFEQVDFGNQNETAEKLNKFVEDKTEGNINKIVENSDIQSDMNLFIINALCFKGQWIEPFDEPKLEKFYNSSKMNEDDFREIEMIFHESTCENWNHTRGEGWECLGIPYETRQSWLQILLPNKNIELKDLINKLDYNFIQECVKKQPVGCVCATIPTFEIESDMDLEKILRTLGIFEAFEGVGINKIFEDDSHYINKAIHKAGIKIDRYGSFGYAASAFGFEPQAYFEPTIFKANHPFIFFVTLVTDGNPQNLKSILLMGTFY